MREHLVTLDNLQDFCAKGAILLPSLYFEYLQQLQTMSEQQKCCLLPSVLLEFYSLRIDKQIQEIVIRKYRKAA